MRSINAVVRQLEVARLHAPKAASDMLRRQLYGGEIMATITFIDQEGQHHVLKGETGQSVMELAVANNVPGIQAECGGACACGTCHIYFDNSFADKVELRDDMEEAMLEYAFEVEDSSRLSCQIQVSDALDGMVLRVPVSVDA
jgi:2Fe-2S ferredoxin